MNRRNFLGILSTITVALGLSKKTYGELTVKSATALGYVPAKVLFNGKDVSMSVIACRDGQNGYITFHSRDEKGRVIPVYGELKRETHFGRVEFFPYGTY